MNLADWLKRKSKANEQLALVAALAQAVEDGHREGTQYAGWSPSSIEVGSDGSVDLSALDSTNRPKDDLAYTAPEAADGGPRTSRSDVYSAGVILYEILAGSHPFGGLSVKQPRGAPKPLGDARRDLPKDLADAVTACLERDPEWRPADLSYVLHVAQEANAKSGKGGGRPTPAPAAPAPARASASSSGGRRDSGPSFGQRAPQRSRLPLILGVLVVLIGASGAAYMFLLQPKEGGPSGGATPQPTPAVAATAAPTEAATEAPATAATAAPTLPTVADKRGTPAPPSTVATPTAAAPTTVAAAATSAPTAVPTVAAPIAAPVATAVATSAPTEAPTVAQAPAGPATMKSISPPKVKRGANALLDVRGENFRPGHKVRVQHKGKDVVGELTVARQRLADPGLLQVLLAISANAPTGPYTMSLVEDGTPTNAIPFEVVQ